MHHPMDTEIDRWDTTPIIAMARMRRIQFGILSTLAFALALCAHTDLVLAQGKTTGSSAPASSAKTAPASSGTAKSGSAAPAASSAAAPAASPSAPAPAAPADAEKPTDSAETLFRRGNDLAKKDQWAEAEPLYREAWKLKQSYDIAANLGLALFQQKKWSESATFLDFALKSFPASGKPENRSLLENALKIVKDEIGTLNIDISVNGASISIDDKPAGNSPLRDPVFVDPGPHQIKVSLDEYKPALKQINIDKGQSQNIKITLEPKPREKPIEPAGFKPGPIWFIAGGAAALVGLGLGVGMTLAANSKASHAADLRTTVGSTNGCNPPSAANAATCSELSDTLEGKDLFSNIAMGGFIGGGVLALATGGLFGYMMLTAPKTPSDETPVPAKTGATLTVAPVIGGTYQGAAVLGTF